MAKSCAHYKKIAERMQSQDRAGALRCNRYGREAIVAMLRETGEARCDAEVAHLYFRLAAENCATSHGAVHLTGPRCRCRRPRR